VFVFIFLFASLLAWTQRGTAIWRQEAVSAPASGDSDLPTSRPTFGSNG
jgi:hypothetical protein